MNDNWIVIQERDPMSTYMYALKAPDTRRQYSRRFQYCLNFLGIQGTLEEQAEQFVSKARQDLTWTQESLMSFVDYQKERVRKGEIAESTITNVSDGRDSPEDDDGRDSPEDEGKILKKKDFQEGREPSGKRETVWRGIKLTEKYAIEYMQQTLGV